MTTDFRSLISRMADELDHYRIEKEGDDTSHPLAAAARAALAEPDPPDFRSLITELVHEWDTAHGDHDLLGVADVMDRARAALAAEPSMTTPTPLSPAAQAVLDAACTGNAEGDVVGAAAAALRAAADQVVKELRGNAEAENHIDTAVNRLLLLIVRDRFNSIATELEGQP